KGARHHQHWPLDRTNSGARFPNKPEMALDITPNEHISPAVARELSKRVSGIKVIALQAWRDGEFLGAEDRVLLEAAAKEGLTFVSYVQRPRAGPVSRNQALDQGRVAVLPKDVPSTSRV